RSFDTGPAAECVFTETLGSRVRYSRDRGGRCGTVSSASCYRRALTRRHHHPGILMAGLIYSVIKSADGYVEDGDGRLGRAEPDEEPLRFVNELERPVGTYLYGRLMYQTMLYWEAARQVPGQPSCVQDFTRIWQAADKIVFSATLASASNASRTCVQAGR